MTTVTCNMASGATLRATLVAVYRQPAADGGRLFVELEFDEEPGLTPGQGFVINEQVSPGIVANNWPMTAIDAKGVDGVTRVIAGEEETTREATNKSLQDLVISKMVEIG